ncbi:MAG: hypothetical protein H8E79_09420 [Desulfobulbaceae bacterium]|uniref:Uncharacterized protein n=1 Tax=Candidatus Desulfatifera sulfidica TaxID=2841691 RepID=A0A8J6N979_9BACT|nr:hypothetical protein [Candidatus Desulfatifera sulfidica]
MKKGIGIVLSLLGVLLMPVAALAAGGVSAEHIDLTKSWVGFTCIAIFVVAYALVMAEEFTFFRKAKPVLLAACSIWCVFYYICVGHCFAHADVVVTVF